MSSTGRTLICDRSIAAKRLEVNVRSALRWTSNADLSLVWLFAALAGSVVRDAGELLSLL